MRYLVSAGPTREPLDPVRYFSNRSTGRMGLAVAAAALAAGHQVALVLGPTALTPPVGIDVVPVETAAEMHAALLARFPDCDVLVMTAAVADYTPRRPSDRKLKQSGAELVVELMPTADILADLGARRRADQVLVGFALETATGEEARALAQGKLARKRLDIIVLDGPSAFGEALVDGELIFADGRRERLGGLDKNEVARRIVAAADGWRSRCA